MIRVPNIDANADPVDYAQKAFADAFDDIRKTGRPVKWSSIFRRALGYILKAIGIFGGLVITAGVLDDATVQYVGIAISAAVAVDTLFSNHVRLIGMTRAWHGYQQLEREVLRAHRQELQPIMQTKQNDPAAAREALLDLVERLHAKINDRLNKLEESLRRLDLTALANLALDTERSAIARDRLGKG